MEEINQTESQPQPRRAGALAKAVAAQVAQQETERDQEAAYAASEEEPAFNRKTGQSNFGKRVAAKIALAR